MARKNDFSSSWLLVTIAPGLYIRRTCTVLAELRSIKPNLLHESKRKQQKLSCVEKAFLYEQEKESQKNTYSNRKKAYSLLVK